MTRERLLRALRYVAVLVSQPEGRVYLPIFERLEKELALLDQTAAAIERAKAFAKAGKSTTPTKSGACAPR